MFLFIGISEEYGVPGCKLMSGAKNWEPTLQPPEVIVCQYRDVKNRSEVW